MAGKGLWYYEEMLLMLPAATAKSGFLYALIITGQITHHISPTLDVSQPFFAARQISSGSKCSCQTYVMVAGKWQHLTKD